MQEPRSIPETTLRIEQPSNQKPLSVLYITEQYAFFKLEVDLTHTVFSNSFMSIN